MTIANWCIVTPDSGSGNGTVKISAPVSEEKSARSVDLLVKAGQLQRTVTVIQEAAAWVKVYLQGTAGIGTVSNAVNGTGVFDQIVGKTVRLTATVLAGYTFDGWYVNGTKVGSTAVFDYVVTGGVTLTAKAIVATYSWAVSVNANGGSGGSASPSSGTAVIGETASVALYRPSTPANYSFAGWSANNGATISGDTVTVRNQGTTTVTANWTYSGPLYTLVVKSFTGGGTASTYGAAVNVEPGTRVNAWARGTQSGWTWDGWYYAGTKVTSTMDYYFNISGNIALEARWIAPATTTTTTSNP